jgi:hypothetical protein
MLINQSDNILNTGSKMQGPGDYLHEELREDIKAGAVSQLLQAVADLCARMAREASPRTFLQVAVCKRQCQALPYCMAHLSAAHIQLLIGCLPTGAVVLPCLQLAVRLSTFCKHGSNCRVALHLVGRILASLLLLLSVSWYCWLSRRAPEVIKDTRSADRCTQQEAAQLRKSAQHGTC